MTQAYNEFLGESVDPNLNLGAFHTRRGKVALTPRKLDDPDMFPGIKGFADDITSLIDEEEEKKPHRPWTTMRRAHDRRPTTKRKQGAK